MTRKQLTIITVAQILSYIMPGALVVIAAFGLMPFKPHGRVVMLFMGIALCVGLGIFHSFQWLTIRKQRATAVRRAFERMEYP